MVLPSHPEHPPLAHPHAQRTLAQLQPPAPLLSPVHGSSENDHFSSKHKQEVLDPQPLSHPLAVTPPTHCYPNGNPEEHPPQAAV